MHLLLATVMHCLFFWGFRPLSAALGAINLVRSHTQQTLQDIIREVARTLDRTGITRATQEDQPAYVREILAAQDTL
jgi:hypothetical protein